MGTAVTMETTPATLCQMITGAIDELQCIITFTLFKISFQHDVLSEDPSFSHVPISLITCLFVPQVNFECFVSVFYCHIPYTFVLLSVLSYFLCLSFSFV